MKNKFIKLYSSILEVIEFGDLTMIITCNSQYVEFVPKQFHNHYKKYGNIRCIVLNKSGKELFKSYHSDGYRNLNKIKIIEQVNHTLLLQGLGLS